MDKYEPIRSISRCISVLQAINRAGALSLADVARASGVPYPTAFRIIQTLLQEGMIEREPARKTYRATALTQTLSNGFQSHGRLVNLARPFIIDLTNKHGWPVTIASHVGHRMIIRDSTHALTSLTFNHYYPGYTLPILESAVGRAYLAYIPEDERNAILEKLDAIPELADWHALQLFKTGEMTDIIRSEGYAATGNNRFTQNPGQTSSIAVPLYNRGLVEGALAMVFFSASMRMADAVPRYLADIQRAAHDISQALSDYPEPAEE
jgi:IclR family mhp operon transcriptional activator